MPVTVGLLVKTWGRILRAGVDANGNNFMVIDDGAAVAGFSEYPPTPKLTGLYVLTGFAYSYAADVGKYAVVTGIGAVRTDYDFDDPSYAFTPEAMMNVRFVKPLPKETGEPDITILPG